MLNSITNMGKKTKKKAAPPPPPLTSGQRAVSYTHLTLPTKA